MSRPAGLLASPKNANQYGAYAPQVLVENMMARDAAEGVGAFLEKRTPHWEVR
jgi:hypothetical protein